MRHAAPRTWPNCPSLLTSDEPTSMPNARATSYAIPAACLPRPVCAASDSSAVRSTVASPRRRACGARPCPQPSADPGIPRGRGTGGTAGSGGGAACSGYLSILFMGAHRSDIRQGRSSASWERVRLACILPDPSNSFMALHYLSSSISMEYDGSRTASRITRDPPDWKQRGGWGAAQLALGASVSDDPLRSSRPRTRG